jgi:hypothetical protein
MNAVSDGDPRVSGGPAAVAAASRDSARRAPAGEPRLDTVARRIDSADARYCVPRFWLSSVAMVEILRPR